MFKLPPPMKKYSRLTIVVLLLSAILFPADIFCALPTDDKDTDPSFEEYVFYFLTALALGKWAYDKFLDQDAEALAVRTFSESDSSSYALEYILSENDKSEFRKLKDEVTRIGFINVYWKKYDLFPLDEANELKAEFDDRIKNANIRFSLPGKRGWKTDRGRIWIIYGQPQEIIMEPMSASLLSDPKNASSLGDFEIWYYDKTKGKSEIPSELDGLDNGRMFFLFSRESGNAEYVQIFSTELGEMVDARFHY